MQRIVQRINMPMVHVGNKPCILRETLALIKLRMQAMPAIKGELCDACSRPCERKNSAGVFRAGARRCWQKEVSHNVKA